MVGRAKVGRERGTSVVNIARLLIIVPCLFSNTFVEGADAPKDADEEYLSKLMEKVEFRDGVPAVDETHLDADLTRVRSLAKDPKRPLARYLAFKILCAVKEPKQLEFLLDVLKSSESKALFNEPDLMKFLAAQVTTEDDNSKVSQMLTDEALSSQFLWALRNTNDGKIIENALNPKYGDNQLSAFAVNEFVIYRLDNKLSLNPKVVEPFLKRSCIRQGGKDKDAFDSARIAARLGFKWSSELLMKSVAQRMKRQSADSKALPEKERIEFLNACISSVQTLSRQDFGLPSSGLPPNQIQAPDAETRATVESAAEKCLTWWKSAQQDPQFTNR